MSSMAHIAGAPGGRTPKYILLTGSARPLARSRRIVSPPSLWKGNNSRYESPLISLSVLPPIGYLSMILRYLNRLDTATTVSTDLSLGPNQAQHSEGTYDYRSLDPPPQYQRFL